jgi:DNA-binding response OmpR family regulator
MLPVLIIDDAREDMIFAERVIRRARLLNPIRLLRGGAECISYFDRVPKGSEPSLVFLDLVMFPVHGLEVLRRLRGTEVFDRSLVVMLTGLGDVRCIQEGYQAGATTFMIKPFNLNDLTNFLRAFSKRFFIEKHSEGIRLHWATEAREDQKQVLRTAEAPASIELPSRDKTAIDPAV